MKQRKTFHSTARAAFAMAAFAASVAAYAAEMTSVQQNIEAERPQATEVTVNTVQIAPAVVAPVVVPAPAPAPAPAPTPAPAAQQPGAPQGPGYVAKPDPPGRVTEVRDEHVEVIDGKLELVSRTIKQSETRVVGEKPVPPPPPTSETVEKVVEKVVEVEVAAAAVVVAATEPPSLEPPAADAAEPRRLIRYFCRCWKDGDFERMWWAMSPRYRLKAKYDEFCAVFAYDERMNGGLADENIGPNAKHDEDGVTLEVELRFKRRRVRPRTVKAVCEITKDGYRIAESGIIPIEWDNL